MSAPTISEPPELPTFPSGPGLPDQPGVFIPKFLTFLAALQNWPGELSALVTYLEGLSGGGGSGDMLAANNLSDLVDPATALTNLGLSANGKSLVTAGDYAAMKVLLSLVPGTNVQAFSSVLSTYAGINPSANVQSLLGAADYVAFKALLAYGAAAALDVATAAQIQAATASKVVVADKLHDAATPQTLTDASTIAWDMALGFNAKVTITANRTLGTPTNPKVGQVYVLAVIQNGTGGWTMTWPSAFDWGTAGAPMLTTTASKRDRITLFCTDASTPKFDAFMCGKGFS